MNSSLSQDQAEMVYKQPSRNKLNVLVVTLRYPPYVAGGYELLTQDAVLALRQRGHRVHILAGRGEQFAADQTVLPWLEPGLDFEDDLFGWARSASNVERFRLHFLRSSNWKATRRALKQTGADVLFFFNLGMVSLAPILAARCQGIPTLGYIADLWPLNHWIQDWQANPDRAASKALQLKALERAWHLFRDTTGMGRLLVPSQYLAGQLITGGVEPGALRVLPLGMAPAMAARSQNYEPCQRTSNEPLRIICSSMMWSGKGQHVLLEACVQAVSEGVDLELVLAGSGPRDYRERLQEIASRPELVGKVRFAGMLDGTELSRELRRSHVFVLPSLWGEPFGLVTLESMAHGLCPLVSSAGASPEIVRHELDGLVFEAGNASMLANQLGQLAHDEAKRLRLAESAGQRIRSIYDHSEFIDQVERELQSVCLKGAL